ncbi:MAG: transporter substrate-binding domain-containing protein [Negativicutes bacterium]
MKNTKKGWQIILAVVMGILMAVAVTGCSSTPEKKPAANAPAPAAPVDDSLSKIKAKGRLVVGINAEFAPFEFHTMINRKDTIVGFDLDMARDIAKDMGVQLELKELAFDALLTTLQSGQVDVIISGLSATEERRKTVDFSIPYYKGVQVLLTTKDNLAKFNSFSDLKDKKIGLQLSSLQDRLMMTLLPDGKYTKIESMNTLFLSLKSKQIDGIVTTKIVSEMAAAANPEFVIADKVVIDDSSLKSPGSAVALRKNSAALQAQISSTIKRLIDSGQMQKYVEDASKLAGTSQIKK